jgi:hypothetical protein
MRDTAMFIVGVYIGAKSRDAGVEETKVALKRALDSYASPEPFVEGFEDIAHLVRFLFLAQGEAGLDELRGNYSDIFDMIQSSDGIFDESVAKVEAAFGGLAEAVNDKRIEKAGEAVDEALGE